MPQVHKKKNIIMVLKFVDEANRGVVWGGFYCSTIYHNAVNALSVKDVASTEKKYISDLVNIQ